MKTQYALTFALLLLGTFLYPLPKVCAQGTAFTYQGWLNEGGNSANGSYIFRFTILNGPNGSPVGSPAATDPTTVSNGLFTVNLDFGAGVFTGPARWLLIEVRTNSNSAVFDGLLPVQPLLPAPYAIYAGGVEAAGINGTIPAGNVSGSYSNAISLTNANNVFAGNGTGVTNVNAAQLGGLSASNFWQTGGNAGTAAGVNYLGTTDNQPLELKVNGGRALRLEPTPTDANHGGMVNVVGGSSANVVGPGVYGATIAGGGSANYFAIAGGNQVDANFSSVGGGVHNMIQTNAYGSTIGGGELNLVETDLAYSVIGGGLNNHINNSTVSVTTTFGYGWMDVIGGGSGNTISHSTNSFSSSGHNTIAGGAGNVISQNLESASIVGGAINRVKSNFAAIGGGWGNTIQTNASFTTISGGDHNTIQPGSVASTVGGGAGNVIQTDASFSTIGGGSTNKIQDNADASTIGGGDHNTIQPGSAASTVGGGAGNVIQSDASYSTIGGGLYNFIADSGITVVNLGVNAGNLIAGGAANAIEDGTAGSAISGGSNNRIKSSARNSVIAGGDHNLTGTNSPYSAIGGGLGNTILDNAKYATISGGAAATARSYGQFAYASGGFLFTGGDAQTSVYVLRGTTTNSAKTELFLNGNVAGLTAQRMIVPTNGVWSFDILVVANDGTGAGTAGYQIKGVIQNNSGFTSLRSDTTTVLFEDYPAWNVVVEHDAPHQALVLSAIGGAAQTIKWVASVRTVELVSQ